jgi:hypothetical protein
VGSGVVYGVDTDSVDSQLAELGNVTLAACGVGNGVFQSRGSTLGDESQQGGRGRGQLEDEGCVPGW